MKKTLMMLLTKIKNLYINLIGFLFFWNRNIRHKVKDFLRDTSVTNCIHIIKFKMHKIQQNTILLIETNDCHGEVISGYINYFQKLEYNIEIIINFKTASESPFCRLNMNNIKIFPCDDITIFSFLKSKKMQKYRHIFLMSSAYYRKHGDDLYISTLDKFNRLKEHPSLFVVEHDLADLTRFHEENFIKQNRLITLGQFNQGTFISPILFGDIKKTNKNKKTTFITIGAIKSFRKNHQALINAIEQLVNKKLDFEVVIIGNGTLENLPKSVRPYIKIMGRLNFPEMFEQMEKADFFLPLLDPNNPDHERYITTGVTGSAQLIYGFEKVPIIQKKFAKFYRFNNKNAIVFDKDLATAMSKAISLSAQEYNVLQSNLHKTAQEIEQESFDNLKRILE